MNLGFQPGLFLPRALAADGLVFGGAGFDFRAFERHRCQLQSTRRLGQPHDLDQELVELIELLGAKAIDGAKVGTVAGGEHPKSGVFVDLAGDLARAKHARRAGMDEQFEHHRWMAGEVAASGALAARSG